MLPPDVRSKTCATPDTEPMLPPIKTSRSVTLLMLETLPVPRTTRCPMIPIGAVSIIDVKCHESALPMAARRPPDGPPTVTKYGNE